MLIRLGYELGVICAQPTPILTALEIHPDRRRDLRWESGIVADPAVAMHTHVDAFGNRRRRVVAPAGRFTLRYDAVVADSGLPDRVDSGAAQVPVEELPPETLRYLLGSRYCETELMSTLAWERFGHIAGGWARVQTICDYVHDRLAFSYGEASATRTAYQAHEGRVGVCRDFAHLAITLCRAMNIPARYVNGYLGDIGVEPDPAPMDFSAWFEAFIGGRWQTFDARHNVPRTGRVVVARGLDATDVPLIHTFGAHELVKFEVWAYEQRQAPYPAGLKAGSGHAALPA